MACFGILGGQILFNFLFFPKYSFICFLLDETLVIFFQHSLIHSHNFFSCTVGMCKCCIVCFFCFWA